MAINQFPLILSYFQPSLAINEHHLVSVFLFCSEEGIWGALFRGNHIFLRFAPDPPRRAERAPASLRDALSPRWGAFGNESWTKQHNFTCLNCSEQLTMIKYNNIVWCHYQEIYIHVNNSKNVIVYIQTSN